MELLTKSIYANGECFADHSAEIAALRAENSALRADNADLRADNAALRADNADLRADNADLRNVLSCINHISETDTHGHSAHCVGRRKPGRRRGVGGRGPKTEFMKKQLKSFGRFLVDRRYKGDESRLYAFATQCWNANKAKWDKAKNAEGQNKGYSAPKVLADAYKKSK